MNRAPPVAEGAEYVGDLGWMGCPHCDGPVNAKPVRDEAMRAFVVRLAVLIERGNVAPARLVEKLRVLAADLHESVREDTARSLWPLLLLERLDPQDKPREDA